VGAYVAGGEEDEDGEEEEEEGEEGEVEASEEDKRPIAGTMTKLKGDRERVRKYTFEFHTGSAEEN
jgi:hypothetical protein